MTRFVFLLAFLALAGQARGQAQQVKPVLVLDAGGHTDGVTGVAFMKDGHHLVSASRDKTIRVWDLRTGESLKVLRPPVGPGSAGALWGMALAPDGDTLAVAGVGLQEDKPGIFLISLAKRQIKRILEGHSDMVLRLAFAPDGKRLASTSNDGTARIWDVSTGKSEHELRGHDKRVGDAVWSPDGSRLLTCGDDGTGRVWSVKTGKELCLLRDKDLDSKVAYMVRSASWSSNGRVLATGGPGGHGVRLWTPEGTLIKRIEHQTSNLQFSADSTDVLVDAGIFNLEQGEIRVRRAEPIHGTFLSRFSHDSTLVATGGWHGDELLIWKASDGSLVRRLSGRGRTNWSAGWSKDGTHIAWGNVGKDSAYNTLFPLARSFELTKLEFGPSPDKSFLRARSAEGDLTLLRNPQKILLVKVGDQEKCRLELGKELVFKSWTILPGTKRAVAGGIRQLALYDLATGKLLRPYLGHAGDVRAMSPTSDGTFFLSASSDQTMRVWVPDCSEPLMSLFFASDHWIAWTPEGYYAASPGGERLMGWHVNNGLDKLATFYPAAQFRKSLYRPDVIKRLLEAGSIAKALELADKEGGKATALLHVADVLPPLVVVTSPDQSASTVAEPKVVVRALARSIGAHPIVSLRLLLDGRPYADKDGLKKVTPPKVGEVRESWTVQLAPGKHTIAVQAESTVSKAVSEPVEVVVDARRGFELDDPKKTDPKELPCLYVLAIGISDYPGNLKLNYAAKDAIVLGKTFMSASKAIYQKVEVKTITDKDATRRNILQGMSWLKKQMTQRDVAIVSFAGHGANDSDGKFYLLPVDVDTEDLLSSAVPSDLFKGALQSIPGKVIVLLDACHSGAVGNDVRKRSGGSLTDDLRRDLVTDDYGVIVMCSSTGKEFSLESAKVEHGYFTLALVEGLSGKADYNNDKIIHLNELDLYVTNRVKELSNGRQHPVTERPTSIRSFPLSGQWPPNS